MTTKFTEDIMAFNSMYKLPAPKFPTLSAVGNPAARIKAFMTTILDEVKEGEDIFDAFTLRSVQPVEALAMLADWLGDIQIYCASEMLKFGLPNEAVLAIIMQSNFSKLGADGQPSYDGNGKVLKGPGYWKPEPALEKLIEGLLPKQQVVPPSPADRFKSWDRDVLEKFAHECAEQNKTLRDDLHTALQGCRQQMMLSYSTVKEEPPQNNQ